MKTYLTYDETSFTVNGAETVCNLKFHVDLAKIKNFNIIMQLNSVKKFINRGIAKGSFYMEGTNIFFNTVGITHCSEKDTFNELIGRRIAETKAQAQAFHTVYKFIRVAYSKSITEVYEPIFDISANMFVSYASCKSHVTELGELLKI